MIIIIHVSVEANAVVNESPNVAAVVSGLRNESVKDGHDDGYGYGNNPFSFYLRSSLEIPQYHSNPRSAYPTGPIHQVQTRAHLDPLLV